MSASFFGAARRGCTQADASSVTRVTDHPMLSSIRARVVLACVALVGFSVVSSTATDYSVAKASMEAATNHDLTSSANDHSVAIAEWIAAKTRMVSSLQD